MTPTGALESVLAKPETRVREYWNWMAVALFLLTTADMITTFYAAHVYGAAAEANPLMRWVLGHDVVVLVAVNVLAVVLVATLFHYLMRLYRDTPSPYDHYFASGIELWLGFLIVSGLFVFANNLVVIFFRTSLVTLVANVF